MATRPTNLSEAPQVLAWINLLHDGLDTNTLTTVPATTVDATYGAEEASVINALRVTVNEIRTILIAMGASAT